SKSGIARHNQAKVEVLPFRVSTQSATNYLRVIASSEIIPRVYGKWTLLKYHFLNWLGLSDWAKESSQAVKLERISALYLPTWVVDAAFEVKCRGNDGRADATIITTSSRFPGHSWKPMDSCPMLPPPPNDMKPLSERESDPSYAGGTPRQPWDNLAMVDYESFESFQKKKKDKSNVKIKGGIPDPIPFTISPLHLPDMIRKQLELKDSTFTPNLSAGVELPGSNTHGLGLTVSFVGEDGEQLTSPPVRFEPETLKLEMMAAYPILMPLHLAEFSYDDEDGDKHFITFVLGAWDVNGLQICKKEKGEDWTWTFQRIQPADIDLMDMYPKVPVRSSISEIFEQKRKQIKQKREEARALQRKQEAEEKDISAEETEKTSKKFKTLKEWEDELDRQDAEHQSDFNETLRAQLAESVSSEFPIKLAVEDRSLELLKKADWIHLERKEREAFAMRTLDEDPSTHPMSSSEKARYQELLSSAKSAAEPRPFAWLKNEADRNAEHDHPDRKAGLGRYIHWSSPNVQRLSHNVYANRRYLVEAIPEVLRSRKRMVRIVQAGGHIDQSQVVVLEDGSKVSGEKAYQTVASVDLNARQKKETMKPRWLKALEAA
ncbi:hypothetical protein BCV70DRAFT_148868, partial [Testicularia cyperi]